VWLTSLYFFVMLFGKNIIEKSFINWRVLLLIKINRRISNTPCIYFLIPFFKPFVHHNIKNEFI
jgi:hypothetical protein